MPTTPSFVALKARVEKGARHLDKVAPDWFTKVDLSKLNQFSPYRWVAAQIAGCSFSEAIGKLNLDVPGEIDGGFAIGTEGVDCWEDLDNLWRGAIRERKALAYEARKYDATLA